MNITNLDLAILKVLITNKKHALDFISDCDAKLFSPDVWHFATLITQYLRINKDIPTLRVLTDKLIKDEAQLKYITNFWNQLEKFDYNEKEYKHDLGKLKQQYADRELASLSDKLQKAKEKGEHFDIEKHISEIQRTIFNVKSLNQVRSYERKTLKDSISEFKTEYNAKMKDPQFERGIKTGYSSFDSLTGGLRPGELVIIGGESNSGKSMLLMNMALQIWMQENTMETVSFSKGFNILYFSLEMPFAPSRNRVYSRLANVPSKSIRNATLNKEELKRLNSALQFIDRYPNTFEIIDVPRGATVEQVEILFEEACAYYSPDIIVLDYLGLMESADKGEDDWLKLGKITGAFHEFLRVHNLIGLTAVQLNRVKPGKETEEKIGMHRIGRSALILTHANVAIQIETRSNEKLYSDLPYHLIKNRDGELGQGKMIKNLSCSALYDDPNKIDINQQCSDADDLSDIAEELSF